MACASDESLHSLNFNYSQHSETLSFGNSNQDLSPDTFGMSYTHISASNMIWNASIWEESASASFANRAQVEKQAWGGGLSVAYPYKDFELELAYSYSRPELDVRGPLGNGLNERSETTEYSVGVATFLEHYEWSLVPSVYLGYQYTESREKSRNNDTVLVTSSSESGWLFSSSLSLSYLFEFNSETALSPFIGISWTDFIEGKGLTRTTASRRHLSVSSEEESDLNSDGSGMVSTGVSLSIRNYHFDLSIDETIDLPNIGTQVNFGFGVVW